MSYSGVIFDLDGTLLNTLDDMANSMNTVLIKHGFPVHDVEKYKYFVGNGIEKLVLRALPENNSNDEMVKLCLAEFIDEYNKRWHELTKPYSGINELLDELYFLKINMSVLSNKPDNFTKIIIDKFFGMKKFNYVLGSRAGIPKKPDPSAALEISRLSKISPPSYLYLGDSGVDMKTANGAGMYAIGITWGFRKADELLKNGAKALIGRPMELIDFIK
ncbi:HAD family hydrolase [Clostridium sp. MT-14]|jgi:phosphoglycolate phosphatase|uniref:HAD family hydrolase n=1 Tax=Clostridium aromativorans TaxID=2836848 RepID=A0ABS8N7Z9_9CLOT|nr:MULTISPECIES: HAD family hydrolase [Clostridium]KAA8677542.1 HAD family hydrolase [Clostridium sp. HV4-5-A1G]MCC9295786.1 HAD family hydrolase [Clostridium aromativorans]CAB1246551.1 HAD family hydrolase [Clostridiaceae bacterium BL-3]